MRKLGLGLGLVAAMGCSKSSSDGDANGNEGSDTNIGALQLSDLQVSKAVDAPIPAELVASSTALRLQGGAKSMEFCSLQSAIGEFKQNAQMVSMQLCMLENTPGMEWGGKYEIDFASMAGGGGGGGGEFEGPPGGEFEGPPPPMLQGGPSMPNLKVWLDNSQASAGKYNVWVCEDGELTQKITLEGAKKGEGSKGSYAIKMELDGLGSIQLAGNFDNNLTTVGRYLGNAQFRFAMDQMNVSSNIVMDLGLDSGVHKVSVAKEMAASFEGDLSMSHKELVAGRLDTFDVMYGQALSQFAGLSQPIFGEPELGLQEGEPQVETTRSYFDKDGLVAASDATEQFADGGTLFVAPEEIAKLLAQDWTVDFGEGAWDCSGTSALDMSAEPSAEDQEAMMACMGDFQPADLDCFGAGFEPGEGVEGVDPMIGERADEFHEFGPPPGAM